VAGQNKKTSKVFRKGREFLAKTSITAASAQALARQYMGNTLPVDAVYEYIMPITASYEPGDEKTVAYAVRYNREIDGLAVRSNSFRYHIELMVNDGRVASLSRLWPEIRVEPTSQPDVLDQILSVDLAVSLAADDIARLVKTPVALVDVEPCYGNTATELVPAYALITQRGGKIVIDARVGEVIR
jgi:hypothetical protein